MVSTVRWSCIGRASETRKSGPEQPASIALHFCLALDECIGDFRQSRTIADETHIKFGLKNPIALLRRALVLLAVHRHRS